MIAIRSNKPLKFNPIRPSDEGIIELQILDIREFIDQQICVVSIQDSVIVDDVRQVLTVRQKQFSFLELDQLEAVLPTPTGSYMERRVQRFRDGLLFITQNDTHPIYFSVASDWSII